MATVAEKPEKRDPAAKFGSQVDEQIAEATSRIRFHDLAFGGLVLASLVLVYATAIILLDKYLVLPEAARQISLIGFLVVIAATVYWTILRPLRRRVNPLYAAVQVEKTIDDAKNSVVGYVEAQQREDVHPTVRAAMSARAAKSVVDADVNRAVDHRSLLYAGAVAAIFLLVLMVLFFVFRPAQFGSLVSRAFAPFSSSEIATRTQLTLLEPVEGDITITTGQSVTIKVQVGGQIPDPEKPDRVRVLIRHSTATESYEELPLEKGETSRDWQLRVPDYLVRNGFWYKVAGGDAATPEYKVSVRTLPVFKSFEVKYEYPAYVNRLPMTTTDQHIIAYRGTKITLIGTTNRTVKDGRITFEPPGRLPIHATRLPDRPDSLRFEFQVEGEGNYRLNFNSAEGESHTSPPFGIRVDPDFAPTVDITKPEEDETLIPANGQLAVDGSAGDDFGVDRLTLKMKVVVPADRPLTDKPYEEGRSFRREADGTWPKSLEYKDSVDLTQLRDPAGQKVELNDGMILEYWLEAADNRTKPGAKGPEPDPNIGKSKVKRVRITPPAQEEKKDKQDQQKQERRSEEKQHQQNQQQKLDNEERKPQQPPQAQPPKEGQPEPKEGDQPKEGTEPKDGTPKEGEPKKNGGGMKNMGEDEPMPGAKGMDDPMNPPKPKEGEKGSSEPTSKGTEGTPDMGKTGDMNKSETAPMPRDQETRDVENQAREIQNRLEQQQNDGGQGKPNTGANPENQVPPSEPKPKPMDGMDQPPDSPPKEGPKPDMGMNGTSNAAETKPQPGAQQEPQDASRNKPEPKSGSNPMDPMGGMPPSDTKPGPQQDQPMSGGAGTEKPAPQSGANPPMPENQPKSTQDPSGGGAGKPASQQEPKDSGMGTQQPQPKSPADGAAKPKPMPSNDPGTDREPPTGTQPESQPQDGGTAKPMSAPQPSAAKPGPMDGDPMSKPGSTSEPKPAPKNGPMGEPMAGKTSPSETKPDSSKPMGGMDSTARAEDKPTPADQKNSAQNSTARGGNERKLTPEQQKEMENAFKDLADPNASQEKKDQARQQLDKTIGEQNRKEAEQLMNDLQSKDPNKRAEAQKKIDNLRKEAEKQAGKAGGEPKGGGEKKLTPEQQKEVASAAEKLGDPKASPQEKEQARNTLDKQVGEQNRQKIEDAAKGLNSKDPNEQKAARQKLEEMKNQMAKGGGEPKKGTEPKGGGEKKLTPEQQKEVASAMKDLADPKATPEQKEQARQKLDKNVGEQNRKEAEQLLNDLNSKDPDRKAAAEKKLEEMKDQMAKGGGDPKKGTEPKGGGEKQPNGTAQKKVDPKEVEQALQDLNSPDQKTREDAKQKLDDMLGKGTGQEAEEANKQANNPDKLDEQGMGRKKLDELRNRAQEMANKGGKPQPGPGKQPSKEEIEELAKKAEDLNSKDDTKRQAAEKEFDQKIGEENRKKLQEAMKDPEKAKELQKEIEEMAKNNPGSGGEQADGNLTPMGSSQQATKIPEQMKEDARNRAKSAELQLEQFEKNKDNKDLLKDLGKTPEEYDKFLEDYRKYAAKLKQEAEEMDKAATAPPPGAPASNINQAGKVEARPNTGTSGAGVGGPAFAAPGYEDALKKFQKGARGVPAKQP